jgi:LysR family glycine cleavage system transcriptional activator
LRLDGGCAKRLYSTQFVSFSHMKSPPLNALYAFEAFARRGRMTSAADELCVTHGAVSRHIRHLEAVLGVALVQGPRNKLTLTDAGLRLADQLTTAFQGLQAALPHAADGPHTSLHISCPGSLAMKWLIPRLPGFQVAFPKLQVRISESYQPCDFRRDAVDLAIRTTAPSDGDVETTPFIEQFHGPVLAPRLMEKSGDRLDLVAALPRLHAQSYPQAWDEWQANARITLSESTAANAFEHNTYMIEAAAAGLGVALCPWAFVMDDIARGRLVAPFGFVSTGMWFSALRPKTARNRMAIQFRDWLVEEGRATPTP